MSRRVASLCVLAALAALLARQTTRVAAQGARPSAAATDAAFARFFDATTADETSAAASSLAASGITFDEALIRLKRGRSYSADAPRGVLQQSRREDGVEYFYTLIVPDSYTPSHPWQVRMQLHGGVGRIRESAPPRGAPSGRLDGAEQIVVLPYAWRDAPWWTRQQERNLIGILDQVKRTYNVDENRVVLAGVSDGGTGAYYMAMRQTTPFASFLPLNGFFLVLKNEMAERDGDVFPGNLLNKPLFVVNGGRDPFYPTSVIDPYIEHLKRGGVNLSYNPQPRAAHDTSWWPELKDAFEQFVTDHPRHPLPDRLTWQAGDVPARAHWLVIDRLEPSGGDTDPLPDVNRHPVPPAPEFGIRASGNRINRVVAGSNAEKIGLAGGDVVTFINSQPMDAGVDLDAALADFPEGRPVIFTVNRAGGALRLSGRYAPTVLPHEAELLFAPSQPSGRVDLVRKGNTIDAQTRGVRGFTLLLSPDQFDLTKPVAVVVNGRSVLNRVVQPDVSTLLKWAARDNDRTMLFGAELQVDVAN